MSLRNQRSVLVEAILATANHDPGFRYPWDLYLCIKERSLRRSAATAFGSGIRSDPWQAPQSKRPWQALRSKRLCYLRALYARNVAKFFSSKVVDGFLPLPNFYLNMGKLGRN